MKGISSRAKRFAIACALAAATIIAPGAAFAETGIPECQGDHSVSPALLAQAQQRISGESDIALAANADGSIFPSGEPLGLSTTGKARVAVIRVSFPASEDGSEAAETIPESESDEDLLATFNGAQDSSSTAYPYESLHAYYERSSFGKLDYQAAMVVRYTALHPRSYYEKNGTEALFAEALAGTDSQADFSQCDANGDGYIDAVYLQFAGACGQWATTWWPKKSTVGTDSELGQMEFDGKHVRSTVMLSTQAFNPGVFNQTLIHETGHVLGLPDLYSYTEPKGPGTGTFDMMENNIGEQNGLFKWLLGWITPEEITYVHTSSQGVDVRVGTGEVVHYDDAASAELSPYTSSDPNETGGFIAVSSDETILTGNLFCSFYLLQFDQPVGNQTVSISGETIGHGVRAFRVQAALNSAKTDFAKSNTAGSLHNQLFEIVDPRESGSASDAMFLRAPTVVSPTTQPSTNFGNSQEEGYSGIVFEVRSETDESAEIGFSWAPQSEQRAFELTPTSSTTINGFDTLSFVPTWKAPTLLSADDAIALEIGGKRYTRSETPRNFKCYYDGSTLYVTIAFNPGDLANGSTAEIVVEKGFFDLGTDESGNQRTSDEIRIPLQIADLAEIEASGDYSCSATHYLGNPVTSDVVTDQDGRCFFFQATWNLDTREKTLSLIRVSEDGKDAEAIAIDASAITSSEGGISLEAVDLKDGTAFLRSLPNSNSPTLEGGSYGRDAWIDLASGEVLAVRECEQAEQSAEFFAIGNNIAFRESASGNPLLAVLKREGGQIVKTHVSLELPAGISSATSTGDAGDEFLFAASAGFFNADAAGAVALYRSDDVLNASSDAAPSVALFKIDNNTEIYDVKVSNGKVYIACSSTSTTKPIVKKRQLIVYSLDGELINTTDIFDNSEEKATLKISDSGTIAWISYTSNLNSLIGGTYEGRVIFIDPRDATQQELGVIGKCCGAWIGDRWLEIGRNVEEAASEDNPNTLRHWSLTSEMGKESPGPEPTPEPVTPDATDGQANEQSASAMPVTADSAPWQAAGVGAMGAVIALATMWRARRRS